MKPLRDLLAGLLMLAVLLAALFGIGAAVSPERAKGVRDRAVRAADRLTRDDDPSRDDGGDDGHLRPELPVRRRLTMSDSRMRPAVVAGRREAFFL